MKHLTSEAHQRVADVVRSSEVVIDATAGNGHDTLILARLVGPSGTIYAFDLQAEAIEQTRQRLEGWQGQLHLLQADHAELEVHLNSAHHERIAAVMFNLGYLPGGDKQFVTRTDSTLAAMRASLEQLRPGGILTVVAYPGHAEGAIETEAVVKMLMGLDASQFLFEEIGSGSDRPDAPRLFVVRKSVP